MNAFRISNVLLLTLAASACSRESPQVVTSSPTSTFTTQRNAAPADQVSSLPRLTVHKNQSCGCCGAWVKHMQANGFPVAVNNVDNMNQIKERVGVPPAMGSCHTGEVGGYFVEGHVPAEDVKRLLAEHPDAKGLTVPRMPIGSPGMEMGDRHDPYDVLLVHKDGSTSVYSHHGS